MQGARPIHEDREEPFAETAQPADLPAEPAYRRAERRFSVDRKAEIQVNCNAALFRGRIVDLSLSGCYVQTIASACLPLNTAVEISFVLNAKAIRIAAISKRSRSRIGMGFLFVDLGEDARRLLKQFIKGLGGNAEDSDAADPACLAYSQGASVAP